MIIIGVGCGPDLITVEAIKVLEKSEDDMVRSER